MPTEIETILTESEYEAALVGIEKLWHAKPGTPECDRLDGCDSTLWGVS